MHLGFYSFLFFLVLSITFKSTIAITGCIVTLISPTSVRRKVLCADPKQPIDMIPEGLPQSTDTLTISAQNITRIEEADFAAVAELTTLFITSSNLKTVHKYSFKYLKTLIVLDLSGNSLTISDDSLPVEIFSSLYELRYLRLSSNPLGFIPDLLFKPMYLSLRKLILNKCDSPSLRISPRAFKDLHNIEELDLRESGITTLLPPMEIDLREMKFLKRFLVGGNNFLCDCKFRWFYFYLTQIQETVTISQEGDKDSRCLGPEKLANKRFPVKDERQQLRYTDFICSPKCSTSSPKQFHLETGASINLTCQCFTDPVQRLTWTKNGHAVEEIATKYRIFLSGKESFQSTLNILSLEAVDSGNWSCKLDSETSHNFSLKVKSSVKSHFTASINIYILVGLGSSLFLISLVIIMIVIFCRRDSLCQLRSQHPMVICGYETNIRKASMIDGDVQYRYNQQDGRFNASFYENTIPFDSSLSQYRTANHMFPDDLLSEKNYLTKSISKSNNDKMLNIYCGCNSNSDDENDIQTIRSSFSYRTRQPRKPFSEEMLNPEEKFQQLKLKASQDLEKLVPNIKQCQFHGSSGTLTRIPGQKPCPVHGSTATLPSRLSSRRVEHRFGCPKHSKDNISLKSLKLDSSVDDHIKPHRCKSVGKLPTNLSISPDKILSPTDYRPCPLHGDILAAINENLYEPNSVTNGAPVKNTLNKKIHSKTLQENKSLKIPAIGCDNNGGRKSIDTVKNRNNFCQVSSVSSVSHTLTSPVQSSLSSSPLLTSDVHGTLV